MLNFSILNLFRRKDREKHTHEIFNDEVLSVFNKKCALCGVEIDNNEHIEINKVNIPVCLLCSAKAQNGSSWVSILKGNCKNEKRKYSNMYLRILLLI